MGLTLSPHRWVVAQVILYLALCSCFQCGIPKTLTTIPEGEAITDFRGATYVIPEAFYRPAYVTPEINPGSRLAIAKNKIVDAFFKQAKKGRAPSIWEIKHVKEKLVPDAIQEIFGLAQAQFHSDETIKALIEGLEKSLMGKGYTPEILKSAVAFQQGLLSLSTRTWKDSSKMSDDTIKQMLQRNGDYIRNLRRNDPAGQVLQSTLGTSEMLDHKLSPHYATVDSLGKNIEFDRALSEISKQIRQLAVSDSPRSASHTKQIPKPRPPVPFRVVLDVKTPSARPQTLIKQLREMLSPQAPVSFQTKTAALVLLHHTAHWNVDEAPWILRDHSDMLKLRNLAASALKELATSDDRNLIFPDHRALINASLK